MRSSAPCVRCLAFTTKPRCSEVEHWQGGDAAVERAVGAALLRLLRVTRGSIDFSGDLAAVAPQLAAECGQLIDRSECMVVQATSTGNDLAVLGAYGPWAEQHIGRSWPVAGTLGGLALETQRPVESVRPDAVADEREPLSGGGMGAIRMVPFPRPRHLDDVDADTVAPAVLAIFRTEPSAFSTAERGVLDGFTEMIANAVRRPLVATTQRDAQLHSAVHDMRAPLTVIGGYVEMMQEALLGEVPPGWVKPVAMIEKQVEALIKIVDGLLGSAPAAKPAQH